MKRCQVFPKRSPDSVPSQPEVVMELFIEFDKPIPVFLEIRRREGIILAGTNIHLKSRAVKTWPWHRGDQRVSGTEQDRGRRDHEAKVWPTIMNAAFIVGEERGQGAPAGPGRANESGASPRAGNPRTPRRSRRPGAGRGGAWRQVQGPGSLKQPHMNVLCAPLRFPLVHLDLQFIWNLYPFIIWSKGTAFIFPN